MTTICKTLLMTRWLFNVSALARRPPPSRSRKRAKRVEARLVLFVGKLVKSKRQKKNKAERSECILALFLFFVLIEFKVDEQICSEARGQPDESGWKKLLWEQIFFSFFWVRGTAEGKGGLLRPPLRCRVPKIEKNRVEPYGLKGKPNLTIADVVRNFFKCPQFFWSIFSVWEGARAERVLSTLRKKCTICWQSNSRMLYLKYQTKGYILCVSKR